MNKLIGLLILLSLSCVPCFALSSWSPIAEKLKQAVVFIEMTEGTDKGTCSGVMIDSVKHYVLSAGHCDGEKIMVDGTQAIKMFKDDRKDILILRVSRIERPALSLAKKGPDVGDEVASLGYGYGLESPMFRLSHVSIARVEIESLSGPFVVVDAGFIPGQSGGPVVNQNGEIVALVQRTAEGFGIGIGADTIRDRVGRYFGNEVK